MEEHNENLRPEEAPPMIPSQQEPLPEWLLTFVIDLEATLNAPVQNTTQQVDLPEVVLSDHERDVTAPMEAVDNAIEPSTQATRVPTLWDEEDAVVLGEPAPGQVFASPVDELKIMLDEDPQQAIAFILAHCDDPAFMSEAVASLRAYLMIEPENIPLQRFLAELLRSAPSMED